ncbi:hypothetical protein [Nocardioides euryhalodurans]|uniref:Glycosyltransferase n=1 Tax=Nocardioides euryhalodurans TaxID=2518370 RepID=A0A4V1BE50_9ACTN|nr:hypothetical protein [Nocardioides euryhalodurans]QBR93392.1 hypothetical protein EXE57_14790 [Nocardioides euryhalodurans]
MEASVVRVITPVPEGLAFTSRPARLLDEVSKLMGIEPMVERGGRSGSGLRDASRVATLVRPQTGSPSWCFHPLYFVREAEAATWIDAYDDYSLAPDMSWGVRLLAARNYRALRAASSPALVTVNSRYMQLKLRPRPTVLVPNGVSPDLAAVPTTGDDRLRVIVMGHFFDGRTDWRLLDEILHAPSMEEVIVVGEHPRVDAMVTRARTAGRPVQARTSMTLQSMAGDVGERTVFAIPHVVSDYTLSQDLMKAYQAIAMGLPVCVPNALWPHAISRDLGQVFERGVGVDDVLSGAARTVITPSQRHGFAADHAWSRRAERIAEAMPSMEAGWRTR